MTKPIKLSKANLAAAEDHFHNFLRSLGFNPEHDPHMKGTPARVVKLYTQELFAGIYNKPPGITIFEGDETFYDQMIFSGQISVRSTCSHHMLPIVGHAHVGILLNENSPLPGLSKYSRIVHHFAAMPQVQERLTDQVADYLQTELEPKGVGVMIRAKHFCQCHRGVQEENSHMITTALRGVFMQPHVKQEFLATIALNRTLGE